MLAPGLERRLAEVAELRAISIPEEVALPEVFAPRRPAAPSRVRSRAASTLPTGLPESDEHTAFASVALLRFWLAEGRITSRALVELYLDRIARFDGPLQTIACLTRDRALREAQGADQRRASGAVFGPLDGIPYLAKDLIDTAGVRTARGSRLFADRVPEKDAIVITRLSDGGAVLLGKAACGELGYGDISADGLTRNPWNLEEGSSGSSSGSAAAVASGFCAFALGTDTIGSTIMPAERCGVVGFRPTYGSIAHGGIMPIADSLDRLGIISRAAEDVSMILAVVGKGERAADPISRDVSEDRGAIDPASVTLGYDPAAFNSPLADECDREALDAAKRAGFQLRPFSWPSVPFHLLRPLAEIEAAARFAELTLSDRDDSLAWQGEMAWPNLWRLAWRYSAVDYVRLRHLRNVAAQALAERFEAYDALITPHHAGDAMVASSFSGQPSLSLPCGFAERPARDLFGRPIAATSSRRVPRGISLIGRPWEDSILVAIAAGLADALGVTFRPPLYSDGSAERGGAAMTSDVIDPVTSMRT
jgi:Asp-tRNA(Asn)/Glu-tRNA(Gln) amidotransferase A subunit family amidase